MKLYRLESRQRSQAKDAFSGQGGLYAAGRWNSLGTRVVYASSSIALACLETLAHLSAPRRLEHRWLFTIEVPDELVEKVTEPPPGWESEPAGAISRRFGDAWVHERRSVALLVPSVIVPMECNALINPAHPAFLLKWVQAPVQFQYDPRLK